MRSVDVVFPASICAIIPMLRVSSSLNALLMCPCSACFADTCFPDSGFADPCFVDSCCARSLTVTIQPSIQLHATVTSDSARKPCWLRPCDAHLLFSSWRRRERSKRRSTRQPTYRSWSCPSVPANTATTSEWPAIAGGKDLPPREPGNSRRLHAASLLPVVALRSRPPY